MNPESGKKKKIKSYQTFYDILRKYGYDTEIIFTREQYDAERIMKVLSDDIDLVVSAGGDGTLNEIVSGNMQRKKKLLVQRWAITLIFPTLMQMCLSGI